MGGNLFKLGRMPRARYLEVEAEVRAYLDAAVGPELHRVPRYYASKPDFGDLDVVVCEDGLPGPWDTVRRGLLVDLGITRHRSVGPLFSTVFRDLQVDFFPRPRDVFLSTYDFLSFNDVGNLLGKMLRRLGIRYGEDGLHWVHRGARESYRRDLLLSRDARRGFTLLGLDPAPWERGFDDLEAMFRWVTTSPFFSVEPYLERSRSTERALRQRRTMREFVAFLERERVTKVHAYETDRTRYLPLVAAHFPEAGLERLVEVAEADERRALAIDARLDGALVMRLLPDLTGRALGEFLRRFRTHRADLDEVLLAASDEEIDAMVLAFHRSLEGEC